MLTLAVLSLFVLSAEGAPSSILGEGFVKKQAPQSTKQKTEDGKKWGISLTSDYSRGAHYLSKSLVSHGLKFSYRFSKLSLSASGAYLYPIRPVTDSTPYGRTNLNVSVSRGLKIFPDWGVRGGAGVVLPFSEKSRNAGHRGSARGLISYGKKIKFAHLRIFHDLYYGSYRFYSDKSGYRPNRLLSSTHNVSLLFNYKQLSLSGTGRLYLYLYRVDKNPDPRIETWEFKGRGVQGASFRLAYNSPGKGKNGFFSGWGVYSLTQLNIPVVSPVLTGAFPLKRAKNWSWSLGAVLKL